MVQTNLPSLECSILRVEASFRIRLPQPLLRRVGWITGEQPVSAWLLLGSPGRCRLLSEAELEADHDLQTLRERITAEANDSSATLIEFRDEASTALAIRLLPVQITPPKPGWRITLPKEMAAIMQIRPGESDVAALFTQNHIEIWTVEALRSAVAQPLTEIL
jgi:hypothetical protein